MKTKLSPLESFTPVSEKEGLVDFNQILARERGDPLARSRISRHRTRLLGFALLLALCPSFVQGAAGRDNVRWSEKESTKAGFRRLVYYLPNRLTDFLDILRINVAFGLGAGINIRPTKGLQLGVAAYDSVRVGLRGRRYPFWHEWSLEGGFDGMYYEGGETERGFYEFGGTIHVLLVGFEAAFDIEEALDFGYGIFLSDPADDDFR